jgi:hypothetical protein
MHGSERIEIKQMCPYSSRTLCVVFGIEPVSKKANTVDLVLQRVFLGLFPVERANGRIKRLKFTRIMLTGSSMHFFQSCLDACLLSNQPTMIMGSCADNDTGLTEYFENGDRFEIALTVDSSFCSAKWRH